jgi:prepilin-type N-terminal cleavage/methylation domain-containing protein
MIGENARTPASQRGFTLLEVLITLAILGYLVPLLQTTIETSFDRALTTKVNRQLRALANYQIGQITVGKIHPSEEDPFPDGQSGTFDDVGGYPEEYENFSWSVRREEVPICGANEDDLLKAGFQKSENGALARPLTGDVLSGSDPNVEKPAGQFKCRVTLTVHWRGSSADFDQDLTIVTYLPVDGEEDSSAGGAGGGPGAGGANPGDANAPGAAKPSTAAPVDRTGPKRGG